ncbi:jg14020 [Pararge aegeria aegeria]|uniref:Jg14020 protein n=1 Tax=Pararge aegeria aegeria TaxID=348720 RepID=A0A8S4R1Z9_9NEOP|nr:jg14020 [Pararge aegeria aegeria]
MTAATATAEGGRRVPASSTAAKCRKESSAVPLAPTAPAHLSLAPARTRVYLYVLSFGGFKPNPPRPQSALRRPPRPRRRRLSLAASPPPLPRYRLPTTDSPAKLAPKSTGADVLRVLIATSGHRNRAVPHAIR